MLDRARESTNLIVLPELQRGIHPLRDLRALLALYRVCRRGRYDIVHTHSSKAGVLGRLAAKLARTPIVIHTLHSLVYHPYQPRVVNYLLRLTKRSLSPLTDHYICVAKAIEEQAVRDRIAPAAKMSTIYSGMELDWFLNHHGTRRELREKLGIPEDAVVVGKVARLFPLKGHEQLMAAMPQVVARHPDVVFLLVGDGPLTEEIEAEARRTGVADNLVFAGLVPREEVPDYVGAMDILAHTSLREGLARVLPQAIAMGVPCVAVDLDGSPEVVIDGETGFLVPPKDGPRLAAAISKLVGDSELRDQLAAGGRRVVDPRFRAEKMVADIASVYEDLVARRGLGVCERAPRSR